MAKAKTSTGVTLLEGIELDEVKIKITNAGDGLSKALEIEPRDFHKDETVHIVLECKPNGVDFRPVKDTDNAWTLAYVLRAGRATIVDGDLVADVLDAQDRKLEAAAGIQRLPLDGEEPGE